MERITVTLVVDSHGFITFRVTVPSDTPAGEYEARIMDVVKDETSFNLFGPLVEEIPGLAEEDVDGGARSSGIGK